MKKYFRFLGVALFATTLCLAMASCTKDKDDDSTEQNGNGNGNDNGNGNGNGNGGQVQNGTVVVSLNEDEWTVGNGALIWNYVDEQQLQNSNYGTETGKRIIMRGYSQKLTDTTFSYPGFQIWVSRSEHLIARPNFQTNYFEAHTYTLTPSGSTQQYSVGDFTYSNDTVYKCGYSINITGINASTAQISFVDTCILFDVDQAFNNGTLQRVVMVVNGQNVNYMAPPSKSAEAFAVKNENATMVETKKVEL